MNILVIGAADNYTWNDVKPWVLSLQDSGFQGKQVLIVYRVTDELILKCAENNVEVVRATHDDLAQRIDHGKGGLATQSHQLRNFHIWQYLQSTDISEYEYVVITDTRDIYFQRDPSEWLTENEQTLVNINMPSEAITFEKEDWNGRMLRDAFGPYIYKELKDVVACNSGSWFGRRPYIDRMLLTMYLIEKDIAMSGIDQATMNVVGNMLFSDDSQIIAMNDGWGCQSGTVLDPTKSYLWERCCEPRPLIQEDGIVVNSSESPFVLVHQWDRVPQLKTMITKRYEI